MNRTFCTLILGTALLLLFNALPAAACLNDREVETDEQEFRSRYETEPPTVQVEQTPDDGQQIRLSGLLAGGTGLLLTLAGGALVVLRLRNSTG